MKFLPSILALLALTTVSSVSGLSISDLSSTKVSLSSSGLGCDHGQVLEFNFDTNSTLCSPCPRGSYCPGDIQSPVECLSGTYQINHNGTECNICPAGHVCTSTSTRPLKCQPGQWCPRGTYQTGLNTYARYIPATTTSAAVLRGAVLQDEPGLSCPTGYYCPDPCEDPIPCPCGTYNPDTEMTDPSACGLCPMGTFCTGATSFPSQCNPVCKSHCSWSSCSNCTP